MKYIPSFNLCPENVGGGGEVGDSKISIWGSQNVTVAVSRYSVSRRKMSSCEFQSIPRRTLSPSSSGTHVNALPLAVARELQMQNYLTYGTSTSSTCVQQSCKTIAR